MKETLASTKLSCVHVNSNKIRQMLLSLIPLLFSSHILRSPVVMESLWIHFLQGGVKKTKNKKQNLQVQH